MVTICDSSQISCFCLPTKYQDYGAVTTITLSYCGDISPQTSKISPATQAVILAESVCNLSSTHINRWVLTFLYNVPLLVKCLGSVYSYIVLMSRVGSSQWTMLKLQLLAARTCPPGLIVFLLDHPSPSRGPIARNRNRNRNRNPSTSKIVIIETVKVYTCGLDPGQFRT